MPLSTNAPRKHAVRPSPCLCDATTVGCAGGFSAMCVRLFARALPRQRARSACAKVSLENVALHTMHCGMGGKIVIAILNRVWEECCTDYSHRTELNIGCSRFSWRVL